MTGYDTLIVGSGCAGYNCALALHRLGRRSLAVVTEGRTMGTSRNTGSDKQTYYKLSLAGDTPDSVRAMARDLFSGGGMDGGCALAQAAGSTREFFHLVQLGVPFPFNALGEYVGYRTDHDATCRATSAGPLTSRYMTEALEQAVSDAQIPVLDRLLAVEICREETGFSLICVHTGSQCVQILRCRHLVLATGGEAGAYENSVYPPSQTGALGLCVSAGLSLCNLMHWQYGIASVPLRWNLSGSYQQVLPSYVSVDEAGVQREFLAESLGADALADQFRKGYEWPFDSRRADASSAVDLAVQREYAAGRRVYLDFRHNPANLPSDPAQLPAEAAQFWRNSALSPASTPAERLERLNPAALQLFADHGIDLRRDMLEIRVCAQHLNGGVEVDENWQSSCPGLYVIGEAAGTFGAYRPGGSALNAAQVGGTRAAQHIALTSEQADCSALPTRARTAVWEERRRRLCNGGTPHLEIRRHWQRQMSLYAAHHRQYGQMCRMLKEVEHACMAFDRTAGCTPDEFADCCRTRDILIAQAALLRSMVYAAATCSFTGGCLVTDAPGCDARYAGDLLIQRGGETFWRPPRPLPEPDTWFESVWRDFNAARTAVSDAAAASKGVHYGKNL